MDGESSQSHPNIYRDHSSIEIIQLNVVKELQKSVSSNHDEGQISAFKEVLSQPSKLLQRSRHRIVTAFAEWMTPKNTFCAEP